MDVDAILPEVEMAAIDADTSFWEAIEFLLLHASLDSNSMEELLESARIPDIPEIHEAYRQNRAWLQELVSNKPS